MTKNFGLFISFCFKNASVECILDPEAALLPQGWSISSASEETSPSCFAWISEADNAGDWKAVEPRYAASLGLVEEQHVGPDLKSKGDALCFARVEFLLEQAHQSLIGGLDHTQPPRLAGIPDLGCPWAAAALFYDLLPDRRRYVDR